MSRPAIVVLHSSCENSCLESNLDNLLFSRDDHFRKLNERFCSIIRQISLTCNIIVTAEKPIAKSSNVGNNYVVERSVLNPCGKDNIIYIPELPDSMDARYMFLITSCEASLSLGHIMMEQILDQSEFNMILPSIFEKRISYHVKAFPNVFPFTIPKAPSATTTNNSLSYYNNEVISVVDQVELNVSFNHKKLFDNLHTQFINKESFLLNSNSTNTTSPSYNSTTQHTHETKIITSPLETSIEILKNALEKETQNLHHALIVVTCTSLLLVIMYAFTCQAVCRKKSIVPEPTVSSNNVTEKKKSFFIMFSEFLNGWKLSFSTSLYHHRSYLSKSLQNKMSSTKIQNTRYKDIVYGRCIKFKIGVYQIYTCLLSNITQVYCRMMPVSMERFMSLAKTITGYYNKIYAFVQVHQVFLRSSISTGMCLLASFMDSVILLTCEIVHKIKDLFQDFTNKMTRFRLRIRDSCDIVCSLVTNRLHEIKMIHFSTKISTKVTTAFAEASNGMKSLISMCRQFSFLDFINEIKDKFIRQKQDGVNEPSIDSILLPTATNDEKNLPVPNLPQASMKQSEKNMNFVEIDNRSELLNSIRNLKFIRNRNDKLTNNDDDDEDMSYDSDEGIDKKNIIDDHIKNDLNDDDVSYDCEQDSEDDVSYDADQITESHGVIAGREGESKQEGQNNFNELLKSIRNFKNVRDGSTYRGRSSTKLTDVSSDHTINKNCKEGSQSSLVKMEERGSQSSPVVMEEKIPQCPLSSEDLSKIEKYKKMYSVGVPLVSVIQKMKLENIDAAIISRFGASCESQTSSKPKNELSINSSEEAMNKIKIDPTMTKYTKMVSVGIPAQAVINKMRLEGIQNSHIQSFEVAYGLNSNTKNVGTKCTPSLPESKPNVSGIMKKIHWKPVAQDKVDNSLWATVKDGHKEIDKNEVQQLESLFAVNNSPVKVTQKKKVNKSQNLVCLIDMKRSNNIAIALAQYRKFRDYDELCAHVGSWDVSKLTGEQLENMQVLLPSNDDLLRVQMYKGEKGTLGSAERFFLAVSKISNFSRKLRSLVYFNQFHDNVKEIRNSLQLIEAACSEVVNSNRLTALLGRLLAVGNLVNECAGKPPEAGITIDSLMSTATKKSSDGKTSMIDYVVTTMLQQSEDVSCIDFWEDMKSVDDATNLHMKYCSNSLQQLRSGYDALQTLIDSESKLEENKVSKCFLNRSKEFSASAQSTLDEIELRISDVENTVETLCLFFAEDKSRLESSVILKVVSDFTRLVKSSKETWHRKNRMMARRKVASNSF